LQATNEELGGLNQQLRTRSDELERLNNELENIQSSLSQGMVIVDRQLRITRFSPLAVRVFGVVDSDIGQPLIGVPTTVPLPGLRDALIAVVNGEVRHSIEASRAAEASLHEFESLADALDQVVWKRDHTMERFLYISGRIEMLTGWSPDDICNNPKLLEMAIHHDDRAAVAAARNTGQGSWSVTYRITTRHGTECTIQESASVLEESHDHSIVGTLTDITEQSSVQQKTEIFAAGFHKLADADHSAVALLNASLSVIFANQAFIAIAESTSNIHAGDAALAELQLCCPQPGSPLLPGQTTALQTLAQQVLHQGQALRVPLGQIQRNSEVLGEFQLDLLPLGDATPSLGVMLRLRRS
jgi:two-component system CheB/CheR fusion protein